MKDARFRLARGTFTAAGGALQRYIAACLVTLLVGPFGVAQTAPPLPSAPSQQTNALTEPQSQNPLIAQESGSPQTQEPPGPTPSAPAQPGSSQATPQSQQNGPAPPQGTAAAPVENTVGVAASRPAGAAIAPAKQKRARSILIRVGLIVGAAVAIGTVIALSNASPSRPH